jgi:hypothetical protein
LIALAAAYAVALQAVVGSFAMLSALGAVPGLCAPDAPRQPGSDPGHGPICVACPACCGDGAAPALATDDVCGPAPLVAADRVVHPQAHLAVRTALRNLPPSRGPPVM